MNLSSKLLQDAVEAFASLPGIGKKTALRLALHMLKQEETSVEEFGKVITEMRKKIKFCQQCYFLADGDVCSICANPKRDSTTVCVVESIRDVLAIEDTGQYQGLYHVLGGVISPIEGIGPDQLEIESLIERIKKKDVKEVIMAISPTIEGDTTIFFISKQLDTASIRISTIARGVSFGGELHYADEVTLGRSIVTRTPYQK